MWAVQWPSSETEAAADATLATGASGPGSLFLPPARLRRSAFRLVLERLEPPSLPSAADAAPPAPEARAPPAPPASPIQSRRAGRCDATPPSCRQQLARTRKSGIARLSAPRRAARPSRRAGAAFAAAPQTHTSLDRDWAEGAWCPRHSVACSLETYVHLGHDPFESGQSHFLAAIPDATVLVELPDGWYAPREAVAAAHAGAAGDGAAMRGATLLPPPLQPPPGLRSPEAASPNPSLSPPALPPGAAGRDSAPASPSRGGAAGPPIGGPGADPQTTAAYLDIRRSFDGIRRLAQLQAAIEAETAEISRLRAAGGGRWAQGWAAGEPPARAEPAPAAARERGPGASQLEALRREAATCGALAAAEEAAAEAEEAAAAEEDRLAAEAEAELARLAVLCRAASHRTARAERAAQVWAGMLQERRRAMVSELGGLYPILERDAQSRIFSIRGLLLAEGDGSRQEEENTSTALGYVAHSTLMLAMCLGVRLRYEVLFVASRSYVRDSMDPFSPPRLFPLFSKGRTTDDFRVGLRMLRRNVEQLLLSQGCPVPERAPLLANLRVLLHSMLLASREEEGGSAESAAGREGAAGTTASMGGGSAAGGAMAW